MLKAHLLRILSAGPLAGMIVSVLRIETGVRLRRTIGEVEFSGVVGELKNQGFVEDGEEDTFTSDQTLKLTPAGRKAAAKL